MDLNKLNIISTYQQLLITFSDLIQTPDKGEEAHKHIIPRVINKNEELKMDKTNLDPGKTA
jgi:hypothetical protein